MIVLRTRLHSSILVLTLLTLALAGCSFTTDTVATVGGERITVGELNAAMARLGADASDRGAVLDQLIDNRILQLEARARNITVTEEDIDSRREADRQLAAQSIPGADPADGLQQLLTNAGITSGAAYRENIRERILLDKMRLLYAVPIDAVTLQQLITDDRGKAQEALDKARAGVPFNELVQQYAIEGAKSDQVVNSIGSVVPATNVAGIQRLFPRYREGDPSSIRQGECSDVQELRGQAGRTNYGFVCVSKTERRDPTSQEQGPQFQAWLKGLRQKYPVTINPELNLPAGAPQR